MSLPRFDFYAGLQLELKKPVTVVPVFDKVQMHGDKGAVATVALPSGNFNNKIYYTSGFKCQ